MGEPQVLNGAQPKGLLDSWVGKEKAMTSRAADPEGSAPSGSETRNFANKKATRNNSSLVNYGGENCQGIFKSSGIKIVMSCIAPAKCFLPHS
jgi:hypothetical protein